ncbi:MAG: type IV pilin protein [Neisseriaceae bacterium]|nr:type IV pilin protein [Neisseriaceae bacterium]
MLKNQGSSLSELMIVIAVLALLSAIAIPSFSAFSKKGHLNKAKAALVENAHFMEQYYAQHKTFKKTSTSWPDLPHTATSKFDIAFTAKSPQGINKGDRFILCAKPNSRYQQRENRYLEIDQAGYLKICTPKNKQAEPCKNTSRTCQKW